jgi:hypothetical protein
MQFKADGTDGPYADHQAEAELAARGHSLRFYKRGSGTCWHCGRHARLDYTNPAESVFTLSGAAFDSPCEWVGVPYAEVREGDFVVQHSVNGATYGPPAKIDRLTATLIVAGASRYSRANGKVRGMTAIYGSVVRRRTGTQGAM